MKNTQGNAKRQSEIYWRSYIIFDGIGFDFTKFSQYADGATNIVDPIGFNSSINTQIQQIEDEKNLDYDIFERMLIKTSLEDYAPLLFVILANVDENYYHPKVSYKYKCPNANQKKLIRQMISIYPFKDEWVEDDYGFRHLHQIDAPEKVKAFTVSIGDYEMHISDYEEQKRFFQKLCNVFLSQGLNHCYPYGERFDFDSNFDFPICEHHLTRQLSGKRGGGNKMDFKRDLMYRLSYLLSIDQMYKDPFDAWIFTFQLNEYELTLERQMPTRKDARLIADILGFFNIYNAGSYGKRDSRIISLMGAGRPSSDIVYFIIANHPSVIHHLKNLAVDAKLQQEALWHALWDNDNDTL